MKEILNQRGYFLRCVQYLITQKCWEINKENLTVLVKEFFKERKQGSIISTVSFSNKPNSLEEYSQTEKEIIHMVENTISENGNLIKDLNNILSQSIFSETVDDYFFRENISCLNDVSVNLKKLSEQDICNKTMVKIIHTKILKDFEVCRKKVEINFTKCLNVYLDYKKVFVPFQVEHPIDNFKQRLAKIKEFKRVTQEYMKDLGYGVIQLDVKNTKLQLENHLETVLLNLKEVLSLKFIQVLETTRTEFSQIDQKLSLNVKI